MANHALPTGPQITFIEQNAPVDEYGRALYAVCRSILRALIDSVSDEDLSDVNTPLNDLTMRTFAKIARLDRDKGMRGDGFEWAVHEAILGQEPSVADTISQAMRRASPKLISDSAPNSILFGQERAKFLGFLDAVVDEAGKESFLLPQGSGRPFYFGPWVSVAAQGSTSEKNLNVRIKKIWKSDLFLSAGGGVRHLAATIKSNHMAIEGGPGLRIGIVPEAKNFQSGVRYDSKSGLWLAVLSDPDGFMGLYNDAYHATARAICTLGKQPLPPYWVKPSAKGQKLQEQLEKHPLAKILEVEDALNEAAQQNLVVPSRRLVGVNAPDWLHFKKMAPKIISPKPKFASI